jgi:hypothetical protein
MLNANSPIRIVFVSDDGVGIDEGSANMRHFFQITGVPLNKTVIFYFVALSNYLITKLQSYLHFLHIEQVTAGY